MHSRGVLSLFHLNGLACPTDKQLALQMARDSAAAGSRYGQYAHARILQQGIGGGIGIDHVSAAAEYRLAALQGLDAAQYELGLMYLQDNGVQRDLACALQLFEQAASHEHPQAAYRIACMYEQGCSVAADAAAAIVWYKKAAAGGSSEACNALSAMTVREWHLRSGERI